MSATVTDPVRGGDILAWAKEVTAFCRGPLAAGGDGVLVRDGVDGIGFEPIPENRREIRQKKGFGCFDLVGWESHARDGDGSRETSPIIVRRYYRAGGITRVMPDDAATPAARVSDWADAVLAVTMALDRYGSTAPDVSFVRYGSFGEMQRAERDFGRYIMPLYLFGPDGRSVACDLRTALDAQMTEV